MSEKRRARKRKEEYVGPGQKEPTKPSKEEYAVAKWMKKHVRSKKTKFLSHNVTYFTSSKALDALMSSHFAEGDACLFPTREDAIDFLDVMLEHRFFHRAKKVPVYLDEIKPKTKKSEKESPATVKKENEKEVVAAKKEEVTAAKKEEKEEKITDNESHVENQNEESSSKEKRKRKIRLEMHAEQMFLDGSEAYVWIYDPVPIYYWIYGTILVLGAIVICLFPLWPPILRKGVYYLSIAAAGFLVFIFALTILRLIVFVIVWLISRGKLYFWIFPNLTEDVGFFASFWPLYEYEYRTGSQKSTSKKQKKKKKEKDSEIEDNASTAERKIEEVVEESPEGDDGLRQRKKPTTESGEGVNKTETNEVENENKESRTISESESEGSRCSSGKDFEIVDAADVDTS